MAFWFKCRFFFAMSLDCDSGTNILTMHHNASTIYAANESKSWVVVVSGVRSRLAILHTPAAGQHQHQRGRTS